MEPLRKPRVLFLLGRVSTTELYLSPWLTLTECYVLGTMLGSFGELSHLVLSLA